MSVSATDSYQHLECQSFLSTIAARGIDIRGSSVLKKAFLKSVIITTTVFVDRLYKLRFVGYIINRLPHLSPRKFADSLRRHKCAIDIHRPTPQMFAKAKALCKEMTDYKVFLDRQHAQMIALHDALINRLLEARATKTFIPFEQNGVHFKAEKDLREEVERITKHRKSDDFVMDLIKNPVQGPQGPSPQVIQSLPAEVVSEIINMIPIGNYRWERTDDCEAFLSNVPPRLLKKIHLDDIAYATFYHSVSTSITHLNQAIDDFKIISGHVGQKSKLLPMSAKLEFEFDVEKLKQVCDSVVKDRKRLVLLCDKFREIVTSLETIVRTRQSHAPFPEISILPKDSNDVTLKHFSRKLRDTYMDLSTTYNRKDPQGRLVFAEKSLSKLRPLLAHDEAVLKRI